MIISRVRTNTVEYATIIRGLVGDQNVGGTGSQGYAFFLNYPTYYVSPAGVIGQMGTAATLLANEQKVFDEYKVTSLRLRFMPFVNMQVRVNTAVAFTAPTDPLVTTHIDYDDAALITSIAKALNAQNPGIHCAYSSSGFSTTMKQRDSVDKAKWLNFGAIIPNTTSPPDPNNPAKLATIKLYKNAYQLAATTEAWLIAEWMVLVKSTYSLS